MSRLQLDALVAEAAAGLDPVDRDHLREELGCLLSLVDDAPPAPSAELAALLGPPATGGGTVDRDLAHLVPLRRRTGPRGAVTGAVVLAVATVGATGLSAAANSLPAPLQEQVADLSRAYLPFDFPRPRGALDRTPALEEQPAPQSQPGVPVVPLPDAPGGRDDEDRVAAPMRGEATRTPQQAPAPSDARLGAPPRSATVTVGSTGSSSPSTAPTSGPRARRDDASHPRRTDAGSGASTHESPAASPAASPGAGPTAGPGAGASAGPEPADASTGDTSPRTRGPAPTWAPTPSVAAAPAPGQSGVPAPTLDDRTAPSAAGTAPGSGRGTGRSGGQGSGQRGQGGHRVDPADPADPSDPDATEQVLGVLGVDGLGPR
ncbi:hypothetical protein ASG49_02585 [Marmoricola sp. Leaf446]|uniref:hypothetical protein n=1 Tax=Marmoricola sp. Leaf446 TaxID=1736379 RepID=UPI0006FBF05D|nr:hypothetical protein [Marmoricola sp. Leaf446]KQT93869.1 hypothetical protein ASG49_02585 [Marmoricola sp. Leaf446]